MTKQSRTKQIKQPVRTAPVEMPRDVSTVEARYEDIATAAYYRAQTRGFSPGSELIDWLEAEREIDADAETT